MIGNTSIVNGTTYTLNPVFSENLYESCKWTTMEGGVVVKDLYANYKDFLDFMGKDNPQVKKKNFLNFQNTKFKK